MNCNADKFKKIIDSGRQNGYTLFVLVIGLSPNGKATDSDSVILKVRILLAQRAKPSRSARFFCICYFDRYAAMIEAVLAFKAVDVRC